VAWIRGDFLPFGERSSSAHRVYINTRTREKLTLWAERSGNARDSRLRLSLLRLPARGDISSVQRGGDGIHRVHRGLMYGYKRERGWLRIVSTVYAPLFGGCLDVARADQLRSSSGRNKSSGNDRTIGSLAQHRQLLYAQRRAIYAPTYLTVRTGAPLPGTKIDPDGYIHLHESHFPCVSRLPLRLLCLAAAFCVMTDVAAKTADALLTAMHAEEPFQLLRTLPGRLQELCGVEEQRVDSEVRESTPSPLSGFENGSRHA